MFVLLDKDPEYVVDFDEEIEALERVINENKNSKALNSFYICVKKTNELIKNKYCGKRPSQCEALKISIKEAKLIR
ncbi:hypothetical protein SDC9_140839 [bioreactor metagenome]|uniref:Uncharacterized protein n=1 Tax=bioreactor metagenome TaxID=1076179 RepID=A0A645DWE7_9ZZZZ